MNETPLTAYEKKDAKKLLEARRNHLQRQIQSIKQATEILHDSICTNERLEELLSKLNDMTPDMQDWITRTIRSEVKEHATISVSFNITRTTL
jgi:ribonuclease HII